MVETLNNSPLPEDAIAEIPNSKTGVPTGAFLSRAWGFFFQTLVNVYNRCPNRVGQTNLEAQEASIGATDLADGTLGAGFYRLSYYARVTRAATTSSSLTVTLQWTDSGVGMSQSGAAVTGNLTTSGQTGTVLIYSDGASPITYSTTYASVGATTMTYRLGVVLEYVGTF